MSTDPPPHRPGSGADGHDDSSYDDSPAGRDDTSYPGSTPASTDILAAHHEGGGRRPASWWLVGGVGVLVLALVAGVAYAVGSLSGGGTQPEEALPAGAFAFVDLDLDPSAGQKIDAVRFLRKFPALRDKIGEDEDLRRAAFDAVADEAGWGDVDFDRDVEPWLGKRVGAAAYPPAGGGAGPGGLVAMPEPRVVVALQVTDEGAAKEGLDRLIREADAGDKPGYVLRDGYALLAQTQKQAERAAGDAEDATLDSASTFSADMAALDSGVATAWVDMDAANKALGLDRGFGKGLGFAGMPGLGASGRTSYVLRFDGANAVEVTGKVVAADSLAGIERPLSGFTDLPGSSTVALGFTDGDKLIRATFEAMGKAFDESDVPTAPSWEEGIAAAERELGIDLPDDLAVLLGSNLVAAFDAEGTREGNIDVGARVTTDPERASAVLDKVEAAMWPNSAGVPLARQRTDDGVIVASTPGFAARLADDGALGDSDAFRRALPDVEDAGFALWVDLRGLDRHLFGDGEVDEDIEPVDGIGVTAVSDGEGSATYRMRLVVR